MWQTEGRVAPALRLLVTRYRCTPTLRPAAVCLLLLGVSGCSLVYPSVPRRVHGETQLGRYVSEEAYAASLLAEVARAKGQLAEEKRWLLVALREDPDSGDLTSRLALSKCLQGQHAEGDFTKARDKEPQFRPTFARWAICADKRGETARAAALRELAVEVDEPRAPKGLPRTLRDARDLDEARRLGRAEGLSGTPLALHLVTLGRLRLALAEAKVQLSANPNDADALTVLMVAADGVGDESSLSFLKDAHPKTQASPLAQELLSKMLTRRLEARGTRVTSKETDGAR